MKLSGTKKSSRNFSSQFSEESGQQGQEKKITTVNFSILKIQINKMATRFLLSKELLDSLQEKQKRNTQVLSSFFVLHRSTAWKKKTVSKILKKTFQKKSNLFLSKPLELILEKAIW